ncbi:MAG TPA: AAA family ATPase [Candidatus Angelobacter sp.]|nr:AAA family ATPase [Candidatus Angelobacter sp.]
MLIILGGLPGVGKTAIAQELARQLSAVHLRIDSIEQAIRNSETLTRPLHDAGYMVAYAVALDNLKVGRTVIADSVNPLSITRDAWVDVALRARTDAIEIEVVCSDPREHQRRVETRTIDIPGSRLPTWQEVLARDYQPWGREHIVVDTAGSNIEQAVQTLRRRLSQ